MTSVREIIVSASAFSFCVSLFLFCLAGWAMKKEYPDDANFRVQVYLSLWAIWFMLTSMFLLNALTLISTK